MRHATGETSDDDATPGRLASTTIGTIGFRRSAGFKFPIRLTHVRSRATSFM